MAPPIALLAVAAAASLDTTHLRLDPAHPPVATGDRGGHRTWRFWAPLRPEGVELAVTDGVVVTLEDGAAPPAGAEWLGGPNWRLATRDPVGLAEALEGSPGVRRAFPDVVLPTAPRGWDGSFDDPDYGGQWYLDALGMEGLYAVSLGSADTRAAVIDSGIDISHPDLVDAIDDPYDAWADDDDPSPDPGEYCGGPSQDICDEHGTAVSGIVGARADNGVAIVGMCPECRIVPIKLLGESGGSGTAMSADIRAFEHAIADDVAVINNSWGFTESIPVPDQLAEVIERASTEPRGGLGALVVFAAGNDDREIADDELEALPEILCVSATDSYGRPTNYTNYGAAVDVSAPSATVTIAPGDEVITTFGGTSAAAPVATGLAAWAASVDPTLSASELRELLISTAVPSSLAPADDDGHNDYYGYGQISAGAVLDALSEPPAGDTGGDEAPAGCACSTAPGGPVSGAVLSLLAAFVLRRRK